VDDQLRKEVCRMIAGVLIADYDLDPQEDAFLDRLLAEMHLSQAERHALRPVSGRDEAAAIMRRLPQDAREVALSLLLDAAVADGTVHDDERDYIQTIAEELGVPSDEVDKKLEERLSLR
jgi:uncharacterized tellurite resistance protein B-like protein